jgi:hypothetical protein
VFVARKLHEGASPRVILSDKHECWTARKNFWRYISVPRYIIYENRPKIFIFPAIYLSLENFFRMFAEIARHKIVEFGPDRVSTCSLAMGYFKSYFWFGL